MISDPRVDPRLAADLDAAESNELTAYQDSLGLWTIGRGHLLPQPAPGKSWAGFTITSDVSDRYFLGDILSKIVYAKKLPEWNTVETACRQNALVELYFNMGGRWQGFHGTREALLQKQWQTAHDGLLDSTWAGQVQPHKWTVSVHCDRCGELAPAPGAHSYCKAIVNGRADRLANYLLTGVYP